MIKDRFDDLIAEKLIVINNNLINLTFKGKILAIVFFVYRKILGLEEGHG